MLSVILIIGFFTLAIASFCFTQDTGEQLTLTTYYPSPYGVYQTVRLFPCAINISDSCPDENGTMVYSRANKTVLFCNGTKYIQVFPGGGTGASGCYVSYNGTCAANFSNQGSIGYWGYGKGGDVPTSWARTYPPGTIRYTAFPDNGNNTFYYNNTNTTTVSSYNCTNQSDSHCRVFGPAYVCCK
jgi:hypothetical protein